MDKNQDITIKQVGNGFIVSPFTPQGMCIAEDHIHVYRSMAELARFVGEHFDHRATCLESDG